jgi:hypothetical protein
MRYPPNGHAAAWLVIIWDFLGLGDRAGWHMGSLIFLRSSQPAAIAA